MPFVDEFDKKFNAEIIKPLEQQQEALLVSVKKIYPPTTPLMLGIGIIVANILLVKLFEGKRDDFEDRLGYAAERLAFWDKPRRKPKRRRKR